MRGRVRLAAAAMAAGRSHDVSPPPPPPPPPPAYTLTCTRWAMAPHPATFLGSTTAERNVNSGSILPTSVSTATTTGSGSSRTRRATSRRSRGPIAPAIRVTSPSGTTSSSSARGAAQAPLAGSVTDSRCPWVSPFHIWDISDLEDPLLIGEVEPSALVLATSPMSSGSSRSLMSQMCMPSKPHGHGLSVTDPAGGGWAVPRADEDVVPDGDVALIAGAMGPRDLR